MKTPEQTHFEQHYLYHDALDRLEAKERAMRFEAQLCATLAEAARCSCLDPVHAGDDPDCLIHSHDDPKTDPWPGDIEELEAQECTCGPNPDAPACPSCRARAEQEPIPY